MGRAVAIRAADFMVNQLEPQTCISLPSWDYERVRIVLEHYQFHSGQDVLEELESDFEREDGLA